MITNEKKIIEVLRKVLVGTCYTEYRYYITAYEFDLQNLELGIDAHVIISDFELEDKAEWTKWINTYPFNSPNYCGSEEPAKGFLINVLTQAVITDVVWEKRGSIIFYFQSEFRIRVKGEVEIADVSWNIQFSNNQNIIGNCQCSSNQLFLSDSEQLLKQLNLTEEHGWKIYCLYTNYLDSADNSIQTFLCLQKVTRARPQLYSVIAAYFPT